MISITFHILRFFTTFAPYFARFVVIPPNSMMVQVFAGGHQLLIIFKDPNKQNVKNQNESDFKKQCSK
jgi:hypothetical protein